LTHPEGFTGIELSPESGEIDLHSLTHQGAESLATPTRAGRTVVADPAGGSMVTFEVQRSAAQYALRYDRFDSDAGLAATAVVATGPPLGADEDVTWLAGTTTSGDTLLVFATTNGGCRAVWLDRDGGRTSPEFAPARCTVQELHPLRDGTLVEQDLTGSAGPCTFRWYPQLFK